jgi:cyclohexadienyl dehydratase
MNKVSALLLTVFLAQTAVASDDLFELIGQRLSYMQSVAAYKWQHGLPVEDLQREDLVLSSAADTALQFGITTPSSRVFFSQQIVAAKEIQRYWFDKWRRGRGPESAPDLNATIRPMLLQLGAEITAHLRQPVIENDRRRFLRTLSVDGLTRQTESALFDALLAVDTYPDRLTQILDSGQLRVGTTGDYAPFSLHQDDAHTGIDIDLARNLGESLGVRTVLVDTTWPTLIQDLVDNRYDIAMSGVSRNLTRQQVGFFSESYHRGGKTPISQCAQSKRFASLRMIDQPGVRVIVNPGGTNERFVDSAITKATKIVYPDNKSIFDQLLNGEADVMITDGIEVRLQSAKHPRLCATMPGRFLTYLDKGYLMPQDVKLKEYVNLWLSQRVADGTVGRVFAEHIP